MRTGHAERVSDELQPTAESKDGEVAPTNDLAQPFVLVLVVHLGWCAMSRDEHRPDSVPVDQAGVDVAVPGKKADVAGQITESVGDSGAGGEKPAPARSYVEACSLSTRGSPVDSARPVDGTHQIACRCVIDHRCGPPSVGPVVAERIGVGAGRVAGDGDPDPLGTGDDRHESLRVVGGGEHRWQQPRRTRSTRRRRLAVRCSSLADQRLERRCRDPGMLEQRSPNIGLGPAGPGERPGEDRREHQERRELVMPEAVDVGEIPGGRPSEPFPR